MQMFCMIYVAGQTVVLNTHSHFKGLLNGLKDVENGLDKDGKPTVQALTYLQANIHEELFKLIAKRGFDIRNCTLDELNELQRKLGFGWSVSEEDLDGDKDEVTSNWKEAIDLCSSSIPHLFSISLTYFTDQ